MLHPQSCTKYWLQSKYTVGCSGPNKGNGKTFTHIKEATVLPIAYTAEGLQNSFCYCFFFLVKIQFPCSTHLLLDENVSLLSSTCEKCFSETLLLDGSRKPRCCRSGCVTTWIWFSSGKLGITDPTGDKPPPDMPKVPSRLRLQVKLLHNLLFLLLWAGVDRPPR